MIWRLLLVQKALNNFGLLGMHLGYNLECVANEATGCWTCCVCSLNFVFAKAFR